MVISQDAGTPQLTIFVTPQFSIRGELKELWEEYLFEFEEGWHFNITLDVLTNVAGMSFVLTLFSMGLAPTLRDTLDLIKRTLPSSVSSKDITVILHQETTSPSQELCCLVLKSIGGENHKHLLEKDFRLKHQRDALLNVRAQSTKVDTFHGSIFHGSNTISISLDNGELITDAEGKPLWSINVEGTMAVEDIGDSALSLSGIHLQENDTSAGLGYLRVQRVSNPHTSIL